MIVSIQPSSVAGIIVSPTSKSSMQRACAAALLHGGETTINNPGKSNDDLAAIGVIQNLGAEIIEQTEAVLKIKGNNKLYSPGVTAGNEPLQINCGESGLGIRMFAPIAALSNLPVTINGSGSLLTRPMNFFDEIFPALGISIQSNNGKLPINIRGPLQPKNITIDGSLSSQFLTGLLMAFGKAAKEQVTITVTNLKSKPYIDLTLQVMKHFGCNVEHVNHEKFIVSPADKSANNITYTVEGDWSGGAFLLVAGAIAGSLTIKGLDVFSTQADKAILQAIMDSGCNISIEEKQIVITASPLGSLGKAFHFNATDCPDLFPPLVALASYCEGTTVIEGVNRLAHKESNRGLTLQEEFGKMGVEINLQDDLMLIKGGNALKGATVHSHHDHRIAMACAVAALKADGSTIIEEADAINKSYPDFYDHLKQIGASVIVQNKQAVK